MNPLISIVIPAYNIEDELMASVKSILFQDFTNYEIIIVDDGSTDNTLEECRKCAKMDERVHVLHQANSGVVLARKAGAFASNGDWILFVDGDDCLVPKALSTLAEAITQTNADIVQFGYIQEDPWQGEEVHLPLNSGVLSVRELLLKTLKTPLEYLGMCIWNKCYQRKIVYKTFHQIGHVQISHSEDGLFAFGAFMNASKIGNLNKCLYKYRFRANSALRQVHMKIVEDRELFVKFLKTIAELHHIDPSIQNHMIAFHSYESMTYIWGMLRNNNATYKECFTVLTRLAHSKIMLLSRSEMSNWKRHLLFWLICRPRISSVAIIALRLIRKV